MPEFDPWTPRHCCPPKGAEPSKGTYYRVVHHNPPIADDFRIWIREPWNMNEFEKKTRRTDCPAYAISLFSSIDALKRKFRLFARPVAQSGLVGIAEIALSDDLGVMKQVGNDPAHFGMWPYIPCQIECYAHFVERS